ncbi:MAG: tRNA (N(6)-L-threonylcarbamoyladenosine(37)-C(2))-methylthiotransferase MtaB [Clostridia bacterium]|nr:tRNA (N(6)-L-threonylcarbamoyladenosine(37)-C(2))-methylthiotransferase MtaB [Clostridia bacterium]
MKAVVFSLGCKVNECESNALISGLKQMGYEVDDKLVFADLYILNTCAVTKEAEKKSRQLASRVKKLNPNAKVIFCGCATQKEPKAFSSKNPNFLVTGVFNKNKILQMLLECGEKLSPESKVYEEMLPVTTLRTRSFFKVQDGCNNFCSYCIIPYLRGRSRSRNPQSVVDEINLSNPIEAVINGINLSSYNYEGTDLTGLITKLWQVDARIRLGSLEVRVITPEFLKALSGLKNFAPHFHLSLQAGSDAVLKSMNRRYTRQEFIEKVDLIREYFPDAGITTDIIAGFPTETEKDFEDTLSLVDRVNFSDIHPFMFSPREGTVAYKMKDLDHAVKKSRLEKLIEKKHALKEQFALKMQGKVLEFLPEEKQGEWTVGYSENYLRLYVKGDLSQKSLVKVVVERPFEDGAIATVIKEK